MTDIHNQEITGKETDSTTTWILLQIADSAFPTGGFSHSFGFESATKHGFVTEYSAFKAFLFSCLQNTASFSLSFVNESHKNCHNVERIKKLDGMVQAYLSNHVANRASIRQGNSLLDTACKTFGKQEMKNLQVCSKLPMFVVIKIQLTFLRGTEVVCVSGNVFSFLEPIIYVLKEKEK